MSSEIIGVDTQGAQVYFLLVRKVTDCNMGRCVNALSWARDGELLISGGDDHTYVVMLGQPHIRPDCFQRTTMAYWIEFFHARISLQV